MHKVCIEPEPLPSTHDWVSAKAMTPAADGWGRRNLVVISAILGNYLEIVDLTLFSYLSIYIGRAFFPPQSAWNAVLMATLTFGVGFLARPVGAIVLGSYADRQGRRRALLASLTIMFLGTAIIAACPPFSKVGYVAPLLLVVARLLQGFSAGGEFGASTAFLLEQSPRKSRHLLIALQIAGQSAAALTGALVTLLLLSMLGTEAIAQWGWRAVFCCGLIVGPVALLIRSKSGTFEPGNRGVKVSSTTFVRQNWPLILWGIGSVMGGGAAAYVVLYHMPTYLITQFHASPLSAYAISCVSGLVALVSAPIAGLLADRVASPKKLAVGASLATTVLVAPCFVFFTLGVSHLVSMVAMSALVVISVAGMPAGLLLMMEAMPPQNRVLGFSLAYGTGVGVMGGFAPFIVTGLIGISGSPLAPAAYVAACAAVSAICLSRLPSRSVLLGRG